MINNRFIHFETQAQYQAKRNDISSNAIVFVDEGRKIYTHGKEYGGVTDYDWNLILARIDSIENALNNIVIPDVPEDILTGVQVVDPKNGQILVYNINKHAWVNADGNFVTLDTPQTISGEKTFENAITASHFVKSGTDWMYKGGTKNDYVLLADGSVIALSDIIHNDPDPEPEPVSYYNVSVFCTTGGLIDGSSSKVYQVLSGGSQTLVFQVQRGYTLSSVTINGESVTPQTTITLNNVTENTTVRATFTQDQPLPSANTVYWGFSGATLQDISQLSESAEKSDIAGDYTATGENYWWIAMPASFDFSVSRVTMGAIQVVMNETPTNITINGVQYKAYRSQYDYDYATQTITIIS